MNLPQHRQIFSWVRKIQVPASLILSSWMLFTGLSTLFLAGWMMDGFLRNVLDNKERELLASRHLTLSMAYGETGPTGVKKLLRDAAFRRDFIRLTDPAGVLLVDQNPDGVRFNHPLLPMPTLTGNTSVPDWRETVTDRGQDYDLLSRRLPDGAALRMGVNEEPLKKFCRHSELLSTQVGGAFLLLSSLGAAIFAFSQPKRDDRP